MYSTIVKSTYSMVKRIKYLSGQHSFHKNTLSNNRRKSGGCLLLVCNLLGFNNLAFYWVRVVYTQKCTKIHISSHFISYLHNKIMSSLRSLYITYNYLAVDKTNFYYTYSSIINSIVQLHPTKMLDFHCETLLIYDKLS